MLMPNESPSAGLCVMVVEDESLVLFNLEDMLAEMGCTIVGPAMRLEEAQALARSTMEADVALLDVNLGGQQVFPVAEILAGRGIPFVFATGYGREGLPEEWRGRPVLPKPYTEQELASALAAFRPARSEA